MWLALWGSVTVREDFKIKTLKSILHSTEKASSIHVKRMLEDTGKGKGEMKALISLNLNFENSWFSCPKNELDLCLLTVLISKRKRIHHGCYIHNAVEEQDAVTQNTKKKNTQRKHFGYVFSILNSDQMHMKNYFISVIP